MFTWSARCPRQRARRHTGLGEQRNRRAQTKRSAFVLPSTRYCATQTEVRPKIAHRAAIQRQDTVSERLRRWTRNPLGSARRGSNPLGVVMKTKLFPRAIVLRLLWEAFFLIGIWETWRVESGKWKRAPGRAPQHGVSVATIHVASIGGGRGRFGPARSPLSHKPAPKRAPNDPDGTASSIDRRCDE